MNKTVGLTLRKCTTFILICFVYLMPALASGQQAVPVSQSTNQITPSQQAVSEPEQQNTSTPSSVPVQTRLRPGDSVIMILPGETSLNQEIQIKRSGHVLVPEVGDVHIQGLTIDEAQDKLRELLSDVIHDLSSFELQIKQRRLIVNVLGFVEKPGSVDLDPDASIQQAIVAAGGLVEGAQMNKMQVRRQGQVIRFDYKYYLDSGDTSKLPVLQPLDTIFVPASSLLGNVQTGFDPTALSAGSDSSNTNTILLFGEVNQPGSIEWTEGVNLFDLITQAGGPSENANLANIKIISRNEQQQVSTQFYDLETFLSQGGNLTELPVLNPQDTVIVPALKDSSDWLAQSAEVSIYVMGEVHAPGRYQFNNKMHFLDILTAAKGPSDKADVHNIRITHRRGDETYVTQLDLGLYFETGNEVLLPKVQTGDVIYIPGKDRSWLNETKDKTVRVLGAVNSQGRYRFDRRMTILDLLAQAGGLSTSAESSNIVVVNSQCCGEPQVEKFDLLAFSESGDFNQLPMINAGDTVYVMHKEDSTWNRVFENVQETISVISVLKILGGG